MKQHVANPRYVLLTVFLFAVPCVTRCVAEGECILSSGTIEYEQFGNNRWKKDYSFETLSAGSLWNIDLVPAKVDGFDALHGYCDGKTVTVVTDLASINEEMKRQGKKPGFNRSTAVIINGVVPNRFSTEPMGAIWLALCSERFFDGANSNSVVLPTSLNVVSGENIFRAQPYFERAVWSPADRLLRIPSTVHFLDDGWEKVIRDRYITNSGTRYPAPFSQGFTNVSFQIEDYWELENKKVAKKARMQVFWIMSKGGNKGPLSLIREYRITVNSVRSIDQSRLALPKPLGPTLVADRRISVGDTNLLVEYAVTDSFLSEEQVRNIKEFQIALREARERSDMVARPPRRTWPVIVVFVLVTLTFWGWAYSKGPALK